MNDADSNLPVVGAAPALRLLNPFTYSRPRNNAMRATITVPLLASADLAGALSFYVLQLGFRSWRLNARDYTVVSRGHLFIHLWRWRGRAPVRPVTCYFITDTLDRFYREWRAQGVQLDPPLYRGGMRTVEVIDPSGHVLRFEQRLQ